MMFLGQPGRMVGVKCPTQQRVSSSDRYSFATTLGGEVKAQAGPGTRRAWDITLGSLTTPSEVGVLTDFANGAWGPGPFWFLPTDAPIVNLMTEKGSTCDPSVVTTPGGYLIDSPPMDLGADGIAARSVWKTPEGAAHIGERIPAFPGETYTASAWVTGVGGRVRIEFQDANGTPILANRSVVASNVPQRLSVTSTAPVSAATVQFQTYEGITQIARPAITITDQPYEWGDGQGCAKAVVHQVTRDVTKAWDNPRTGRWSGLAFSVQEVG